MCHASSAVFGSLSGHYLPQELHLMTTKLGQSPSNEGGNDNEKGRRENSTWQAISIDRKTKTDMREKANLCGGKHQDRALGGKTRRKERHQAELGKTAEAVCFLTTFATTMELLHQTPLEWRQLTDRLK